MESISFSPYRYAAGAQVLRIVQDPRNGPYKGRAARLAEALGMRYVGRARGYIGTSTQCDRLARLHSTGWDAQTIFFHDQQFPGDASALPEPWMRRRPGLWAAPTNSPEALPH